MLPSRLPGQHIMGDVSLILEDGWDMMIAHPPCTYLCSSGLHWNKRRPERAQLTHEAMLFIFQLIDAPIAKIALENPIGCISSEYRKPDQIIQPWQFGHPESKATCLWLKGITQLCPSHILPPPVKRVLVKSNAKRAKQAWPLCGSRPHPLNHLSRHRRCNGGSMGMQLMNNLPLSGGDKRPAPNVRLGHAMQASTCAKPEAGVKPA